MPQSTAPEQTAQVSRMVTASPDEVYDALTSPAQLKQFFFGADVQSDFKVGSKVRMKGEFNGKPYEDKGEVKEAVPGERLSFSHWSGASGQPDTPENYHLVTFELEPAGEATKVTLSQANLTGGVTASDREHRADYEKNWQGVLDGLAKTVGH
jgi:uncharacterized protein YndB with AHSA1/START domain